MKGVIKTFKDTTGHGTVEDEKGYQYFFTYVDCKFPSAQIMRGLTVQFELDYRGNDIPVAVNITKEN